MIKMSQILSSEDISYIKSECSRYRTAGISIQAIVIDGIRYTPPAEELNNVKEITNND